MQKLTNKRKAPKTDNKYYKDKYEFNPKFARKDFRNKQEAILAKIDEYDFGVNTITALDLE